jgi:hypothetical protein
MSDQEEGLKTVKLMFEKAVYPLISGRFQIEIESYVILLFELWPFFPDEVLLHDEPAGRVKKCSMKAPLHYRSVFRASSAPRMQLAVNLCIYALRAKRRTMIIVLTFRLVRPFDYCHTSAALGCLHGMFSGEPKSMVCQEQSKSVHTTS